MAEKINRADKGKVSWSIPTFGVLNSLPIQSLPENAFFDASNVVLQNSLIQPRPGLTLLTPTTLAGRPTGAFTTANKATGFAQEDFVQTNFAQVGANIPGTLLVVGTTQKIYVLLGSGFNDVTGGTDLTAQTRHLSRFTSIQIGTPLKLHIVHVNGKDLPRKWDTVDGAGFMAMTEDPLDPDNTDDAPIWSDVTTINDRIIGIVPPYEVRWGEVLGLVKWPAANSRSLAETPDELVAISNLGLTSGSIYKSNSIWQVVVTGSTDSTTAFRIDHKIGVQGPASPAALVNAGNSHYYMTNIGRIGRWDGYQHSWVADGVWPLVKETLDTKFARHIHGVYKPITEEIWFYYPRIGDMGECKGTVVVKLPNPEEGLTRHLAFPGALSVGVSASTDTRISTQKVILFTTGLSVVGETGGGSFGTAKAYTFEGANDAGTNFSGFFQTGIAAVPGPNPARIKSIETFAERGAGYGTLDLKAVFSDQLDNKNGHTSDATDVDLSVLKPFDLQGVDVHGRYLGVRYEFTTPLTLKWKGAQMHLIDRG